MTSADFEHIARRLRPAIFGICMDFFGSKDDAEDAVQETLIRLWQYCEQIDPDRNVTALAVKTAKNVCVSTRRRRRSARLASLSSASADRLADHTPSPHEALEGAEAGTEMSRLLGILQPRERELFEMRRLEGLSLNEISRQTSISLASVKSMISMARKKLFEEMTRRKDYEK
ncbi:MAG: sigma-70 family RNA polymerase sigma factor [Prevotella sp.]|nr:sigma-70 family RNA polymerase sigma factor [Prevotella sp.]